MKRIALTVLIFLTTAPAYAESIQLNTYYPPPVGVYDRLRFPPRATLTDPCDAGMVYYETGVGLRLCDEATNTWGTLGGGGVWTQDSGNSYIYPTDTASNPDLNVGIGTTTPAAPLDVNLSSTATTAGDERGVNITMNDTGIVDSGFDQTTGLYTSATRTNTGNGTILSYGLQSFANTSHNGAEARGGDFTGIDAHGIYGLDVYANSSDITQRFTGLEVISDAAAGSNIQNDYGINIVADRDDSSKTDYYGIKIESFADYAQTIVNNYGVYVDSRGSPSTNRYAIYTAEPTDKVFFRNTVGIGTTAPEFKLNLDNDGGIIAKGTYGSGAALTTAGAGTRLIWYPKKAAFRAGRVSGTQWDDANIGDDSIALGWDNTASGDLSTALGIASSATGTDTMVLGDSSAVSGDYSYALGLSNTVSAPWSMALGFGNTVTGTNISYSIAVGSQNTLPTGDISIAIGNNSQAIGTYSTAIGQGAVANDISGGAMAIGWNAQATGAYATSLGYSNIASIICATAIGQSNKAQGHSSAALGTWTQATANYSLVIGKGYDASHPLPNTTANSIAIGVMSSSTDTTPELFIKDGAVGVGTTTPAEKLTVNGNLSVSGNIISGYEVVTGGGGSSTSTATCPAGKYVIGGGCDAYLGETLNQSYPPDSQSWFCRALNQVTAYAVCARLQ